MRHLPSVVLVMCSVGLAEVVHANVYSYTNADGDYVVSQTKPSDPDTTYAVLTDDGEFLRMVEGRNKQVPISHWRPFFLPREPHPFDGPEIDRTNAEPVISIDEVASDSDVESDLESKSNDQ